MAKNNFKRLTTDTPNGNFETMMNFAYAKGGKVWLRGVDDGKDVELCEYITKHSLALELCGVNHPSDVVEACASGDCSCSLGALFAAATQAAEMRARLKKYEDTGLEPEEIGELKTAYDENQAPYNKTCDWTICIYKKGCASEYPSSENNGEDDILCKVDDCDMEVCFARAHVALKDWLLEYEGGY